MTRVLVDYHHDPADLHPIDVAVVESGRPGDDDWIPALRDTVDGRRVVRVRASVPSRYIVWLRDRHGVRDVHRAEVSIS